MALSVDSIWYPPLAFDGFEVVRPLGRGGMGAVFLGHDTWLNRPTALKFIGAAQPEPRARQRFLTEARALARLHHANVVGVYRVGEIDGQPYLAYEFVGGTSLLSLERPVPWRRALDLAIGIGRGLAAAHRAGVIHRDVKPSNVVLTEAGEPKLIDFGIAKLVGHAIDESARPTLGHDEAITEAGTFAGTPQYSAPEVWEGEPASAASDQYALGLLLYELLSGRLPLAMMSLEERVVALRSAELPSVRAEVPDVPAALTEAIARATRRRPLDRFPGVAELCEALEAVRVLYRPFARVRPGERDDGDRIVDSFAKVRDRSEELATHFYDGIFARLPALRALFPTELTNQKKKLIAAIEMVVENLGATDTLVRFLQDLGRRHAGYGVEPAHFEVVGAQLLASLREMLGGDFTPTVENAWAYAYDRLARTMVHGLLSVQTGEAATVELVVPSHYTLPLAAPPVSYVRSGEVTLAYQVLGQGPIDLVMVPGYVTNLESAWLHDGFAQLVRRLASFVRVILLDRRGSGLSDRVLSQSLDEERADLQAVMTACGADRPVLFGWADGFWPALTLAAMDPDRVRAVVGFGTAASAAAVLDAETITATLRSRWGGALGVDRLAPSHVDDPIFAAWWAQSLRAAITLGAAEQRAARLLRTDLTALLPAVRSPIRLLHRRGDRVVPVTAAATLGAQLPGVELHILEGNDHAPFVGDTAALVDACQQFLMAQAPRATAQGPRLHTVVSLRGDHSLRELLDSERLRADAVDLGEGSVGVAGPVAGLLLASAIRERHPSSQLIVHAALDDTEGVATAAAARAIPADGAPLVATELCARLADGGPFEFGPLAGNPARATVRPRRAY